MTTAGDITSYIDVAQLALYAFWIFFAGLVFYLRREDKREGYPLESDRSGSIVVQGFPPMPPSKTFHLPHGGTYSAPSMLFDSRLVRAIPTHPFPGAPLQPTGDAMVDGVGPAAYAARADAPDLTLEGEPKMVALRASDFYLEPRDPDPRGMRVVAADRKVAGVISDVWVDRSDATIRYFEVDAAGRVVLLPVHFARINAPRREVHVYALYARHFAQVPTQRQPDRITMLEEDRITAFYAGGKLYADIRRAEPLL